MAKRKIQIIQTAINADSEGNERIVALREDGEIFTYYMAVDDDNDRKWRKVTPVPDDE